MDNGYLSIYIKEDQKLGMTSLYATKKMKTLRQKYYLTIYYSVKSFLSIKFATRGF